MTPDDEMQAAGYDPQVPYPGKVKAAWLVRCTTCKLLRRPTLQRVRRGYRCGHLGALKHREAVAEMRAAGYEPLTAYPGRTDTPWPALCTTCNEQRAARLSEVRQGVRCRHVRRGAPGGIVDSAGLSS